VGDLGTILSNSVLYVGYQGASNNVSLNQGGHIVSKTAYIGFLGGRNTFGLYGESLFEVTDLYVGFSGAVNQVNFMWNNSGNFFGRNLMSTNVYFGYYATARSNTWIQIGPDNRWLNTGSVVVGRDSADNQLLAYDHASIITLSCYVGYNASSSNNLLLVDGDPRDWDTVWLGDAYVGYAGPRNQLRIEGNGGCWLQTWSLVP
jgi:hypothetical protein